MNRSNHRFETFDLVTILVFFGSAIGLFFYGQMNSILFLALAAISIWSLLILAGRFAAPFYLEGRMVRFLMANNGSVQVDHFKSYFKEYSNFDVLFRRLIERNNIEVVDKTVLLKSENLNKGIKNKFMLWGTRKVKI